MNRMKKIDYFAPTEEELLEKEKLMSLDKRIEYWVQKKDILLFIKGRLDDTEKYSLIAWKILEMLGVQEKARIISVSDNPEPEVKLSPKDGTVIKGLKEKPKPKNITENTELTEKVKSYILDNFSNVKDWPKVPLLFIKG